MEIIMSGSESEVLPKRIKLEDKDDNDQHWGESASSFCNLIRTMLDKRIHTDCIIKVEMKSRKKEIECHSLILKAHSPVLEVMLSERWTGEDADKNSLRTITVTDDNPDHFSFFVQMMYWDWSEQTYTKYKMVDTKNFTPEITVGVLSLAYKYLASHLIRRAEHVIYSYLCDKKYSSDIGNITKLYTLLKKLPICDVGQVARRICRTVENCLINNGRKLLSSNCILRLSHSNLLDIVKRDELQCSEQTVYAGCLKWALKQCEKRKLSHTGENVRTVLGDVIKFIRFPLMDNVMLTETVRLAKILTEEEMMEMLIYKLNTTCTAFDEKPIRFPRQNRVDENTLHVRRLDVDFVAEELVDFSTVHGFTMKINHATNLSALGFYCGKNTSTFYKYELAINEHEYVFNRRQLEDNPDGETDKIILVSIQQVKIPADTMICIKFSVTGGPTYVSKEIVKEKTTEINYWKGDTIICNFGVLPSIPNGLNQIPLIIFSSEATESESE